MKKEIRPLLLITLSLMSPLSAGDMGRGFTDDANKKPKGSQNTPKPTTNPKPKIDSRTSKYVANLLKNASTPEPVKINLSFARHTTAGGDSIKITGKNKYKSTQSSHGVSHATHMGFTRMHNKPNTKHHSFGGNTEIETAYKNFIDAVHTVPSFLPLFRKIHIIALHQIYLHLVGIYTTLNMTHINDLKTYIALEKQYGLNKKTLIINHLMNVIQAQLSNALQVLFPGIPKTHAIKGGMATLEHDVASNPDILVLNLEKSVLAVLGVAPLSLNQVQVLMQELQMQKNTTLINANKQVNQTDFAAALQVINQNGENFVKALSPKQAEALVEAIDTLVAHYTASQTTKTYQAILDALKTKKGDPLSTQQFSVFQKVIGQCTFGIPLDQEITVSESIKKALDSKQSGALAEEEITALQGIIAYILQQYEQQTAVMLSKIIQRLGELNPEAQIVSPSESIALKKIATALLAKESARPLGALEEEERFLLSYALHVESNKSKKLTAQQKTIIKELGKELASAPLAWKELSQEQTTALRAVLQSFTQYVFSKKTQTDIEKSFTQEQQQTLAQAAKTISSNNFKDFNVFSKEEQLLILKSYQGIASVVETRLEKHKQQGTILKNIFEQDQGLEETLFASIQPAQYQALVRIDKLLQQHPKDFALSMLPTDVQTNPKPDDGTEPTMSATDALSKLFSIPEGSDADAHLTYLAILYKLQDQHFQNQALLSIIQKMPASDHAIYSAILKKISAQAFDFASLTDQERQLLIKDFQLLHDDHTSTPVNKNEGAANLENPNENLLETVSDIIHYTHNYTKIKTSFLWVLKQYLTFFSLYNATLQEYNDTGYSGLTKYAEYAESVSAELANTPLEQINPPIFFYNKETMRGIKLLPQLAKLVESTEVVPYPTFAMTQAIEGATIDPLNGKKYENTVHIGSFSYQRFFFIDLKDPEHGKTITTTDPKGDPQSYQPPPEITGKKPAWITKKTVPVSDKTVKSEAGKLIKNYDYIYVPTNIPQDGLSGFYMNVPVFTQNPHNKDQALVRLFEQPIFAQPQWLNYPGFSNKDPDKTPGVITMLRGCLGDFKVLLDLNVFDPCITMIFKSALEISDKETTLKTESGAMQDAVKACSAYMDKKAAEIARMKQIDSTIGTNNASSILNGEPNGTVTIPGS